MSITATDIVSQFGDFYQEGSANLQNLRVELMQGSETDQLFTPISTNDTIVRDAFVEVSNVLQAYQDTFTRLGDTTFSPLEIILDQLKIDVEENPTKLKNSWLGFLGGKSIVRSEWPFVRWWLEKLIIPASRRDWEMNAVYAGVKGSVTPGTALSVASATDGIKKQINNWIDDSTISPIVVGAVPTDAVDFVDYVEAFIKGIDDKYLPTLDKLAMNKTLFKRFREGMRAKYNMNYGQTDITSVIDFDIPVVGLASMTGSNKLWITVQGNAVRCMKDPQNEGLFKVEDVKRMVSAYTDYYKKCTFVIPQYVFTNDVELPA